MKRLIALAGFLIVTGCKESGPKPIGPPASMAIVGGSPTASANTDLTGLSLVVRDANNNPLPNQTVTFAVQAGGGSIQTTSATTGADGTLTVPAWRMGRLDIPQVLRATVGGVTFDINASIQTAFDIVLRFYGTAPTTAQRAMFDNAVARIQATITGDLQNVGTGGQLDISACTPGQQTTINETIDDLVIYVRLRPIDGRGNIVAAAGPCFVRDGGTNNMTTVIGLMEFDTDDLSFLREETILHEMLHVVGFGSMWHPPSQNNPGWGLVVDDAFGKPRYTGQHGVAGCREVGGTVTCASTVPVEDTLGPGTARVHWEDSAFDNELMTGFIRSASVPMPMSRMTVQSLRDIGYTVNLENSDPYTKPFGALRAAGPAVDRTRWERPAQIPLRGISADGRVGTAMRRNP